jgi:hypothetical protein
MGMGNFDGGFLFLADQSVIEYHPIGNKSAHLACHKLL